MPVTLGRHRDDLPADQFDPLVLVENASRRHRLQLGDGEPPPQQSLGRIRRHLARMAVHAVQIARRGCVFPGSPPTRGVGRAENVVSRFNSQRIKVGHKQAGWRNALAGFKINGERPNVGSEAEMNAPWKRSAMALVVAVTASFAAAAGMAPARAEGVTVSVQPFYAAVAKLKPGGKLGAVIARETSCNDPARGRGLADRLRFVGRPRAADNLDRPGHRADRRPAAEGRTADRLVGARHDGHCAELRSVAGMGPGADAQRVLPRSAALPAPTSASRRSRFLAKGYVLVATDYQGLGGGGTHQYAVAAAQGRDAINAIRAVGSIGLKADAGRRRSTAGRRAAARCSRRPASGTTSHRRVLRSTASTSSASPPWRRRGCGASWPRRARLTPPPRSFLAGHRAVRSRTTSSTSPTFAMTHLGDGGGFPRTETHRHLHRGRREGPRHDLLEEVHACRREIH